MPRRTAVVIGINYDTFPPRAGISPLKFAEADAEDMASLLREDGYQVVKLLGSEATYKSIVSALQKQSRLASREGLFVVHFSGHGDVNPDDQEAYLLPVDAEPNYLKATAIPLVRLTSYYDAEVGAAITLLDCCHSGSAIAWRGRAVPANIGQVFSERVENVFKSMRGRIVLAACGSNEKARELDSLQHGAFTHYILRHLAETPKATPTSLHDYAANLLNQIGLPQPVLDGRVEGLVFLRASTGQLKSVPSVISSLSVQAQQNQYLHKRLNSDLTMTEFRDLCSFLGLHYSSLGRNKREQAHALIKQMESTNRIEELNQAIITALSHKMREQEDKAEKEQQRLKKELWKINGEIRHLNEQWLALKLDVQDINNGLQRYWKQARDRMQQYRMNERRCDRNAPDIQNARFLAQQTNRAAATAEITPLTELFDDVVGFAQLSAEEELKLPQELPWSAWLTDIMVESEARDPQELDIVINELALNHERIRKIGEFQQRAQNRRLVEGYRQVQRWIQQNPNRQCPQTLLGYLSWLEERERKITEPYDRIREYLRAAYTYKESGRSIWGQRQYLHDQHKLLDAKQKDLSKRVRMAKAALQATSEDSRRIQMRKSLTTNKRTTGRRKT